MSKKTVFQQIKDQQRKGKKVRVVVYPQEPPGYIQVACRTIPECLPEPTQPVVVVVCPPEPEPQTNKFIDDKPELGAREV